jgi:hypothetical protein
MLKWLIRRRLAAFEGDYNYDASYLRDMLETDTRAALAFNKITDFAKYRRNVPRDALFAAGITTTLAEDCGPCTQLGVTMAEREGVAPDLLRAILNRDVRAMNADAALAFHFTMATLAHNPAADDYREEIEKRWGKRAVISLALNIAAARVYPTVKYALGHGKTCQRVTVGGTATPVLKQAA